MDQYNEKNGKKTTVSICVSHETRARIDKELARINNGKEYGRPVRADAYIALAITLVEPKHEEGLREASLTNQERLDRKYREYVTNHGAISKDEFFGLLLEGRMV